MRQKLYPEAILLNTTSGTRARLQNAAKAYGQTMSEYLRQLIRKALERDKA